MKRWANEIRAAALVCLLCLSGGIAQATRIEAGSAGRVPAGEPGAEGPSKEFVSRDAQIEGVKIHYTTGGHGAPLILLHGYAQTSRMWTPILPVLGEKFTVIAPDLPGIGDSSIPPDGLDMASAAKRIHALVRSLGGGKSARGGA